MRAFAFVSALAILSATAVAGPGAASEQFDVKLSADRQAVHVLNRLAFGPRPGEIEEVRRIGAEAWIRQQLDPERMADPEGLAGRLDRLGTLRLAAWQILEKAQPPRPQIRMMTRNINQLLASDQVRRLMSGTPEDRRAVLAPLTPEARERVLATVSPAVFQGIPDLMQQAERARQIQNEIRNRQMQEQMRRLRPPLPELLTPAQARDLQLGTTEEKVSVLASLDPETRTKVYRAVSIQSVPDAFRREALLVMNPHQAVVAELVEAKLQRAVYSSRQLEEILVDFWFNHFNVFGEKASVGVLLSTYERDAIRPHVLGRFRDMLLATAHHPAMLVYLDNFQSRSAPEYSPQPEIIGSRSPGLNENYGRELMELHTLGASGGYTQDDVVNVARAFTGWTIFEPGRYGEFQFNPAMHDRGEKVVLGRTFQRGGEDEGRAIIEMLAAHPSTARFISRKLAQRFVADDPPAALVDRMAAAFAETGGDLRAVMETLLLSREFLSEGAWQAKLKTPFELVVSALRAMNAEVADATALAQRLTELGQPLYGKPEPTGYPETGEQWSGAAGLLGRMNFAQALASREIAGVTVDTSAFAAPGVRGALAQLHGVEPAPEIVAAIEEGSYGGAPAPALLAGVLIGSPDFQRR